MNGIVFLTLSVALQGNVALQGGIEYGWTQLPDNRVEYIIQLDDQALDALKNGQPLTSSIPPEIQNADRVRIQYGSGPLSKPVVSRKPQTLHAPQYSGAPSIADTPPALNAGDLSRWQNNANEPYVNNLSGQVTVKTGNQNTVSNSTMGGTRQTAYVTQDNTTNSTHWSNSNRVIGNYDTQNRTADSRTGTFNTLSPTNTNTQGNTATNLNNTNTPNTLTNNMNTTSGQNTGFNSTGFNSTNTGTTNTGNTITGTNSALTNGFNRNLTNGQLSNQTMTANSGTGMAPVTNRTQNTNGWTSVMNPNQTGYQNQNTGMTNTGQWSGNNTQVNPNMAVNPNLMTGVQNMQPQNTYPNAQNYLPQQNTGFNNQAGVGIPVSTTAPSSEVAALNKTIEEMKSQQQKRDHESEIAKLKADQKAELEKLTAQFKEFQKKKDTPAVTPAVVQSKDSDSRSGNSSGIASVFLVISLGLNVFLVVQYLSVQNQFRDLSNDLRDTFMTNSYE